jgi:hypothetical protein
VSSARAHGVPSVAAPPGEAVQAQGLVGMRGRKEDGLEACRGKDSWCRQVHGTCWDVGVDRPLVAGGIREP